MAVWVVSVSRLVGLPGHGRAFLAVYVWCRVRMHLLGLANLRVTLLSILWGMLSVLKVAR